LANTQKKSLDSDQLIQSLNPFENHLKNDLLEYIGGLFSVKCDDAYVTVCCSKKLVRANGSVDSIQIFECLLEMGLIENFLQGYGEQIAKLLRETPHVEVVENCPEFLKLSILHRPDHITMLYGASYILSYIKQQWDAIARGSAYEGLLTEKMRTKVLNYSWNSFCEILRPYLRDRLPLDVTELETFQIECGYPCLETEIKLIKGQLITGNKLRPFVDNLIEEIGEKKRLHAISLAREGLSANTYETVEIGSSLEFKKYQFQALGSFPKCKIHKSASTLGEILNKTKSELLNPRTDTKMYMILIKG
jgi:hypothetical protein